MEILKETEKAKLLSYNGKNFWIQKRWMRKDGTLTAKGEEAKHQAEVPAKKTAKSKPFKQCKYCEARHISDKAVLIKSFDGQEDIFPTSQIKFIENVALIPTWLVDKKSVQVSNKIFWQTV